MSRLNNKEVNILYFAVLREQRGLSQEKITTRAATLDVLYRELKSKFAFQLNPDVLRVAINDEFVDWTADVRSGDNIAFIPPVAGG